MSDAFSGPATDGVDDVDKAVEGKKANRTATKGYGAVNTRCTVTGEIFLNHDALEKSGNAGRYIDK